MAISRAEKIVDQISEEFDANVKKLMEMSGKSEKELLESDPFVAGQAYVLFKIQARLFAAS